MTRVHSPAQIAIRTTCVFNDLYGHSLWFKDWRNVHKLASEKELGSSGKRSGGAIRSQGTTRMSTPSWHLSVNRAAFAKALKLVGRAAKAVRSSAAILTFDEGLLTIDVSGNVNQIPATGDWPSEVRLPGGALERLAKALPDENPLQLKVEGERLFMARFSVNCEWRVLSRPAATPVPELIPPDADPFEILMIRLRCSDDEIDAAGATKLVAEAEGKIAATCAAAARILAGYGVTAAHLRRLCKEHAAEGTRKFREADALAIGQIAQVWKLLAPYGVDPAEIKGLMDTCLRNSWKKQ